MNDEEKEEFDKKLEEKSKKEYYPKFKDFGFLRSIFYVIGLLSNHLCKIMVIIELR